jgi:hypothetical protein
VLICDAGQQDIPPPILEKVMQVHIQHNLLSQSIESKLAADKSQDNFKVDQVEHKNMTSNVHKIKLKDNASHDKVLGAKLLATMFQDGNSLTNTNQEHYAEDRASTSIHAMLVPHAGPENGRKVDKAKQGQELHTGWSSPIKRCKRREGLVDEDSSTRAQCLKAIKNLDAPGTTESKSFLSFSNAKIRSTIRSLGFAFGSNLDQGIDLIKEIECGRLLEAPNLDAVPEAQDRLEDFESEVDSDFGHDLHAIKHLTQDIAENVFGFDGSPLMNFKSKPRHRKASSGKKTK